MTTRLVSAVSAWFERLLLAYFRVCAPEDSDVLQALRESSSDWEGVAR